MGHRSRRIVAPGHPAAFGAWLDLGSTTSTAMQALVRSSTGDLTSAAAQQALRALWQHHWTDMKAWYQQYGGGATDLDQLSGGDCWGGVMWGSGYGSGWLLRATGRLRRLARPASQSGE